MKALINGNESETEQEYESDLDDSVFDKTYDPTEKQMDQDKQPTESSTQLEHGQKSTQNEKAKRLKKDAVTKKEVTTLKLSTVKTGSGRIQKPLDVNMEMLKYFDLYKRNQEASQNNQYELAMK